MLQYASSHIKSTCEPTKPASASQDGPLGVAQEEEQVLVGVEKSVGLKCLRFSPPRGAIFFIDIGVARIELA